MQEIKILSIEVRTGRDGCPVESVVDLTTPDGEIIAQDRYSAIKDLACGGWDLKCIEPLHYTNGVLDQEVLIFCRPKSQA